MIACPPMPKALLLWLLLFAGYTATLGLDSFGASDYGGDEPHHLLAARSLVDDGDIDVRNQYADRSYRDFYPYALDRHGEPTDGRLHEPHGVGLPLLIAPAFRAGGATGAELLLAAVAALGMVLAYRLALRVVPDPWALGATVAVGLSPPFIAYGTAVYPELTAGAALAGAALLAVRLSERASRTAAFGCFALLGALPWLGTKFVPAGIVVAAVAAGVLWRARRVTLAIGGIELLGLSGAGYVAVNQALYGGLTPYAAEVPGESATDADFPAGYLERSYRLVALFLDRDYGLLRWIPVLALAFIGVWLLRRARRARVATAIPYRRHAQLAVGVCAAALGAQLLVAAFLSPTMFGFWFPGRHLLAALPLAVPLVAWGLRRAPRWGSALAALGVAGSLWLYLDVRVGDGGLAEDRPAAPFGPLTELFPYFGDSSWPYLLAAGIGLAFLALVAREAHHWRKTAADARARYSG